MRAVRRCAVSSLGRMDWPGQAAYLGTQFRTLTAQLPFNFLAARTHLLACALYGRFRLSRLLRFIAHFVSLLAGDARTVLGS
jgi:hypothetical protein